MVNKKVNNRPTFIHWLLAMLLPVIVIGGIILREQSTDAAVTSNGVMFYGDTTNAGQVKIRSYTNPATFAAEISTLTSSASNITHIVAKTAPTRQEMMVGHLKVDGRLDILSCTTGCDSVSPQDFTARWNNPGTTPTQDCDSAPTLGTCEQAFDIAYESLSGRALVVYGDNVADKAYYAIWDGSSWSPNSTPGTPGVSNEINLPGTAGTPEWIRVVPAGDNLAEGRSNRAMVLISDTNADLHAFYWDGSAFDSGTTLIATLGNCDRGRCFDGNWQFNTNFVASYSNSGVNEIRYNKYVVGTGWGSDTQAYTTAAAPIWIISAADPTSSRVYVANYTTGADTRGAVWRADNATDGWTVCASGGCPDTTLEGNSGAQVWAAFERYNGEAIHAYNDAGNLSSSDYMTYTPTSTWGVSTTLGTTSVDDLHNIKAWGSPNSDDVMIAMEDIDCDLDARLWDGSALSTAVNDLELLISNTNNTCANNGPISGMGAGHGYDFAWKIYSPWQRNWRFYSGADTAATPSTALAAENTAPSDIATSGGAVRLRINYAERGNWGVGNSTSRKKLQYTTSCNPNTSLEDTCTWTDVDDVGGVGIWRYKDCNTGTTACDDNQLISASVLTGTNATCTAGNGCGTFVLDKDNAAGANMTHNSGIIQESEWSIESNGATAGVTYYFRIYDIEQSTMMFREQDNNDCGAGAAQCTYPSLSTVAPGPTMDQVMRGGNWFNGGTEQSHFWAN